MKALTLEILRGGFLPPNTFSLLLKAICIIASRQGVKYFLKTQLCFCRLILGRKKGSFSQVHWERGAAAWNGSIWLWWDSPCESGWLRAVLSKGWAKCNPCTSNLCARKRHCTKQMPNLQQLSFHSLLSFVYLPSLFISTLRPVFILLSGGNLVTLVLCCREEGRFFRAVRSSG